jgi:hypothetical protein
MSSKQKKKQSKFQFHARPSLFSVAYGQKKSKTYSSGDSLVVVHLTTNPPVSCSNRAERTGSLVFTRATATKPLNFPVCGHMDGLAVAGNRQLEDRTFAQHDVCAPEATPSCIDFDRWQIQSNQGNNSIARDMPCEHSVARIDGVTHARSVILTGKPSTG